MANSNRKQSVQPKPSVAGDFRGIPIEVRNDCPPGTIYFLNASTLEFRTITEKRKWRAKILNTLRTLIGRFKGNQGKD